MARGQLFSLNLLFRRQENAIFFGLDTHHKLDFRAAVALIDDSDSTRIVEPEQCVELVSTENPDLLWHFPRSLLTDPIKIGMLKSLISIAVHWSRPLLVLLGAGGWLAAQLTVAQRVRYKKIRTQLAARAHNVERCSKECIGTMHHCPPPEPKPEKLDLCGCVNAIVQYRTFTHCNEN